jgi:type IV fimbrial biogenesis protein FimT
MKSSVEVSFDEVNQFMSGPNPRTLNFRRPSGFTMLEVLITLIILSILSAVAYPSLREFNMSGAATAQANSLLGNLNTARAEAVKSATNVRVSAIGGNWSSGWQIAVDRNRNGVVDGGDGDRVITETGATRSNFTWSGAQDPSGAALAQFFYGPTGEIIQPTSGVMFMLKRTDPAAAPAKCRRVAVALSGRAESRRGESNPCP